MIYGNDCAGTLASFAGDDQLSGVGGNDRLYGGAGDDTLTGGAGADVFAFAQGSGDDTIIDFDVTTDWLDLSANEIQSVSLGPSDTILTLQDGSVMLLGVLVSQGDPAMLTAHPETDFQ